MTEACSFVNLKYAELTNKYPFELSGGQMQRLMIARIFLLVQDRLLLQKTICHGKNMDLVQIWHCLLHFIDVYKRQGSDCSGITQIF